MKPLDMALVFLCVMVPIIFLNITMDDHSQRIEKSSEDYHQGFLEAVSDAAAYMSRMEEQQAESGIRYSEEKQLSFDRDLLNVFYNNLALKFGVEGDEVRTHNIMMHIPAIVLIRYDGYNLVTLDDKVSVGTMGLEPRVWPSRPYTFELESGNLLYFTLDDNIKVYDRTSNEFIEGTFSTLFSEVDMSPISDENEFREVRGTVIASLIEKDLGASVNNHLELVSTLGLDVQFDIPAGLNTEIDSIGFMAFMQGYPLPGGERLDAYSFSDASVSKRVEFIGTIRSDGTHIAYERGCVPTSGGIEIETLRDAKQAALKGYFLHYCD